MLRESRWFLLAIAWCVALNLRGSAIAVSPILPLIKADLALSYAEAGFLFSVPTILMAVFGLPGGRLADRFGMKGTIALGLTAVLFGCVLRATASGYFSLVIWSALLGAGMGITGPGLTRMVKDRFLDMPGTATGIYISGLVTGATLGSWLTVPYLLQWVGSWRGTFLAWGGLALLALLGWVVLAPSAQADRGERPPRLTGLWRDKTVWKLNIIFLTHNTFFYCAASWTPTYYQELGFSLEEGTLLLTVFILMSLPSSLAIPYFSDRFGGRRSCLILSCIFLLLALLGMIFFPLAAPWVYFSVMGIASGGIFALEFALPLDYVESSQVGSVAGINLLVGYCGAFLGPLLMGLIHDLTDTFLAGWLLVLAIMGVFLITTAMLPKKTVSQ